MQKACMPFFNLVATHHSSNNSGWQLHILVGTMCPAVLYAHAKAAVALHFDHY